MTLYQETKLYLKIRLTKDINYGGVNDDIIDAWQELKIRQIMNGKSYTIVSLQDEINTLKEGY